MKIEHQALLKNIQKVNPDVWETAVILKKILEELKLTQGELAVMAGKKRSTVANYLRLFQLPQEIQEHLQSGKLTMGHAKAILAKPKSAQIAFCREILHRKLSVREAETSTQKKDNVFLEEIQRNLEMRLGTKVQVGSHKITIDYYSLDDLDRILEMIR